MKINNTPRRPTPFRKTACLAVTLLAAGCAHNGQNFSLANFTQKPAAPAPAPTYVSQTRVTSAPYVLKAESMGPYVAFTIYNLGTTDLAVQKSDFAMIAPDASRRIVPYDRKSVLIDMPANTVIPPNGQVSGRAKFQDFPNPLGKRLVFKPDKIGTFADILPPQSPAAAPVATTPPAMTASAPAYHTPGGSSPAMTSTVPTYSAPSLHMTAPARPGASPRLAAATAPGPLARS